MKLISRAEVLTGCQNMTIVTCFTVVMAIVLILTTFASDMLIYDEGNVYSCPAEHLNSHLEKMNGD